MSEHEQRPDQDDGDGVLQEARHESVSRRQPAHGPDNHSEQHRVDDEVNQARRRPDQHLIEHDAMPKR
jgi:hypothetical protein